MQRSGHGFQAKLCGGLAVAALVVLILPAIIPAPAAGATEETPSYYMYFKQRIDVELDRTRLSVRYASKDARIGSEAALAETGLQIAEVEKTAALTQDMLNLETPLQDVPSVKQAVNSLVAAPGVEFASPVFTTKYGWMTVTPDILVSFKPEVRGDKEAVISDLAGNKVTLTEDNFGGMEGAVKLRCHSNDGYEVLALANRMAEDPRVEWAEPDFLETCVKNLTPNDPGYSLCWGLNNTGQSGGVVDMDMDADSAWDATTGDPSILVLVIDDGTQQDHPDINQVAGGDFTGQGTGGGPGNLCDNHGTAVAGCISAIINNGIGTVGVAPDCNVLAAKYSVSNVPCDGAGTFQISAFVSALAWGETMGARVSNCSSSFGVSGSITSKYNSTYANGMVHFCSSGNDAAGTVDYPANLSSVNAVGAIGRTGNRASFSNYGVDLAFVAPGVDVFSTDRTGYNGYVAGDYGYVDGTSFASPYAAGVAALILSIDPNLTPSEVENRMQTGCTDRGATGWDVYYGYGIVNAYQGVQQAVFYGQATPTFGTPPMVVDFQGTTARPAISWEWDFGDGEHAYTQDVTHSYDVPGYYDVTLTMHTATDMFTKNYDGLISVQADTITFGDVEFDGDTARVGIYLRNYVPVTELTLPFAYGGPLSATYRYITVAGARTYTFETVNTTSTVPAWHVATVHLDCGVGAPLDPGEGLIGTLVFSKSGTGTGTNIVHDTSYAGRVLSQRTFAGEYVPSTVGGSMKTACCVGRVGNANGEGGDEPTIGDINALISAIYTDQVPDAISSCFLEADVNQSGGLNPVYPDDFTISDINLLIEYLYIKGPRDPVYNPDGATLMNCL